MYLSDTWTLTRSIVWYNANMCNIVISDDDANIENANAVVATCDEDNYYCNHYFLSSS